MYPEKLQQIVALFETLEDRAARIELLISLADTFRRIPEELATKPYDLFNKVPNCESDVYVWVFDNNGRLQLEFDVINPQGVSAMAMAMILKKGIDGETAEAVKTIDDQLIEKIFTSELSTGKTLGLSGMIAQVKSQAARLL